MSRATPSFRWSSCSGCNSAGCSAGRSSSRSFSTGRGVGRLLIEGAIQRDYAMVQALVLIIAAAYVALNLVAELVHAALDPRIRL